MMREKISGDFWVFGYGSLLWNPGFRYVESIQAALSGYARSFCMRSIHHRGSEQAPGLVLALDEQEGAKCDGVAFRVHPEDQAATLAALRERELVSSAYLERWLPLSLKDGRVIKAVVYVIDPDHDQYCDLPLSEQAQIIARAVGGRGPNTEYLFNTADHLTEIGVEDAELTWLASEVRRITGP
ncbi:MAG: gamma-glutamylcyclotransferase [Maritimibacter sp.]